MPDEETTTSDDPYAGLTDKEILFVNAYIGEARFNASEAARIAGYQHPGRQGYQVKNRPDVAAIIAERLRQSTLAAGEVLALLTDQATASVADFFDMPTRVGGLPKLNLKRAQASGKLHLIAGFDYDKKGRLIVKFHDAQVALVHMGRHHKLFTDRQEVSGSVEIIEQAARTLDEKLLAVPTTDGAGAVSSEPDGV